MFDNQGVDYALLLEDAKDDDFSGSAASTFSLSLAAEIAFIQFHRAVKDFVRLNGKLGGDDHSDFPVKQDGGIWVDAQYIRS